MNMTVQSGLDNPTPFISQEFVSDGEISRLVIQPIRIQFKRDFQNHFCGIKTNNWNISKKVY